MRNTLMTTVAVLGLAATAYGPAFAQSAQTPPSPGASSQMPQPSNSVPAGAATTMQPMPGAALGGTTTATAPRTGKPMAKPAAGGPKEIRPVARMRPHNAIAPQTMPAAVDEASAPPTSAYRGGVGSPLSTRATNLAPSRPETMGSRLPDPAAANASPRDLLVAAQRALSQGKTGAAQEALERAETRVLSRTTDPSMAGTPDQAMMVQNIAQARRALGARDTAGAQRSIAMAMDDRTPPRGPSTTTGPAGVPSGGTF